MYHEDMELSGPSFVIVKNGRLINKYELIARVRTPKGITSTLYYFDSEADAELYKEYLLQREGEKELDKTIASRRIFNWERKDLEEFKESIDWDELPAKIKDIKVTSETVFVELRGIK